MGVDAIDKVVCYVIEVIYRSDNVGLDLEELLHAGSSTDYTYIHTIAERPGIFGVLGAFKPVDDIDSPGAIIQVKRAVIHAYCFVCDHP